MQASPAGADAARTSFGDPAGDDALDAAGDGLREDGADEDSDEEEEAEAEEEEEAAAAAAAAAALDSFSVLEMESKTSATNRRMEVSAALFVLDPSLKTKSRSP